VRPKRIHLKDNLKKILELKKDLQGNDLKRVEREPPRNPGLLSYKIWNQMYVDWPPKVDWVPSEREKEMMAEMIFLI